VARGAKASIALRDGVARLAAAVETSDEANGRHGVGIDANERHTVEPDHRSNDATANILRALFDRMTISRDTVSIALSRAALMDALIESGARIEPESADEEDGPSLAIDVPAQPLRCGKQVRLIVGDVSTERRSLDPKMIRLVADAHRWFEDLRSGHAATIAEIADRDRQQVAQVSRSLSLAFLAPDIVEMILDGRQPPTLTVERLMARRSRMPMDWAGQRACLLG
jgi:hypothetical protein